VVDDVRQSYVFVADWQAQTGMAAFGDFPSQSLRRLVARHLSSPYSDWRSLSNTAEWTVTDESIARLDLVHS
jgi:hypothetical protein